MRTNSGRSVNRFTNFSSYNLSRKSTWHMPSASAGVVPGRTTMTSSPLFAVALYSHAITTMRVPLRRASVSQCASGIFVVIQFIPHTSTSFACSTEWRSNSTVCTPVTIVCPGGRSVCHE